MAGIDTCPRCRFNADEGCAIGNHPEDDTCRDWSASITDDSHIVSGQVWFHPGRLMYMVVHYVESKGGVPTFILLGAPSWDLANGWGDVGLMHWGHDADGTPNGKWLLTEQEILRLFRDDGFKLVNDHHYEWVPNGEGRPPKICREIFGKMSESHDEAGIDNPWGRMPENWREPAEPQKSADKAANK